MEIFILDPGHGLSNRSPGVYDPGATAGKVEEATIALDWANEVREALLKKGKKVVRTRKDRQDAAPVGQRAAIAARYKGDIMVSFHCNAANGQASGTETFYRGESNRVKAQHLNDLVVIGLGTKDRGVKTESQSQHSRLAIMSFQPTFLIELGFIDHAGDREKMQDPELRKKTAEALADFLTS